MGMYPSQPDPVSSPDASPDASPYASPRESPSRYTNVANRSSEPDRTRRTNVVTQPTSTSSPPVGSGSSSPSTSVTTTDRPSASRHS